MSFVNNIKSKVKKVYIACEFCLGIGTDQITPVFQQFVKTEYHLDKSVPDFHKPTPKSWKMASSFHQSKESVNTRRLRHPKGA